MRASRLLSLLLLLQTRGRMTASQLAAELEVSVRTIYRDVESLSSAGVPLYGDAGHEGGYQLVEGYRTRLTGLTADEAEVLFLGGLHGPAAELGLGTALAAAHLKLKAAMPPQLRDRAERIRRRFHLDAPGWYGVPDDAKHLCDVADAVWSQRSLRMSYRRWAEPSDVIRTVDPLGVVLKAGCWYLVARNGESVRTYRVAQILALDVLEHRFERPEGFSLAEHWRDYVADFEVRRHRGEALVRLSPRLVEKLPAPADPAVARFAEHTAGEPDADGWVRARMPIETIEHAVGELLRLGADVEVLAPRELRDRLGDVVAQLGQMYRGSPAALAY